MLTMLIQKKPLINIILVFKAPELRIFPLEGLQAAWAAIFLNLSSLSPLTPMQALEITNKIVLLGLAELPYNYFSLNDGWMMLSA